MAICGSFRILHAQQAAVGYSDSSRPLNNRCFAHLTFYFPLIYTCLLFHNYPFPFFIPFFAFSSLYYRFPALSIPDFVKFLSHDLFGCAHLGYMSAGKTLPCKEGFSPHPFPKELKHLFNNIETRLSKKASVHFGCALRTLRWA